MKVATWNVNSLKVRLPHLLQWLASYRPDIVMLQETKTADEKFPRDEIKQAGYDCAFYGQPTYNGVAILSRTPLANVVCDMQHIALAGVAGKPASPQARLITAETNLLNGLVVMSAYVPNGQDLESDKFQYKLAWLQDFADHIAPYANRPTIIGGDFNIAPGDDDIYDAAAWGDGIHASPQERCALQGLLQQGYVDAHTLFAGNARAFSWWDYRAGAFAKNQGLRIDLLLVSAAMQQRCVYCVPDKTPRSWERPSDHTPVIAEFN